MKYLLIILFALFFNTVILAQSFFQSLDTIQAPDYYENIFVKPLYSDSLVSSFLIFVKREVKAHKHLHHSEHVYVLEGEGEMQLGNTYRRIKKGDIVFIPENTVHALTVSSKIPMKVLSIQAPFFDGSDRVLVEP